jgi:hypothetical protein
MELEFIEKEEYHQGFALHFKEKILPKLSSLETKRLELLAEYKRRLPIGFVATVIVLILLELLLGNKESLSRSDILFFMGIAGGFISLWVCMPRFEFRKIAKLSIVSEIANFFGLEYSPEKQIETDDFRSSKLFTSFTSCSSEDNFTGKLEGLNFSLTEVNLSKKQNKSSIEIFNGEIVEIEMLKNFNGHTVLSEENQHLNISTSIFSKKTDSEFEQVNLEDPEFERIYKVYSTDQIEARYLLTTSFMERVLNLKKILGNPKIKISFLNKNILIAISSYRNLFEPKGVSHSVYDLSDIYKFLEEINEYKKLIQTLKLNQNLGL